MLEPLLLLPLTADPARLVCPAGAVRHDLGGATMGTRWSLRLAAPALPPGLGERIQAELDTVVAEMSHWEPGSHLSRFNAAPADSWHALPPGFAAVMAAALDLAALSDGAFDPAIGAVVDLWGFGAVAAERLPPDPAALAAARAAGGWRRLGFDRATARLHQPGGVRLDLSAIAKGHAVDRVAALLRDAGHPAFLLEIGGELRGEGLRPDGQPWWVDVEPPPGCPLPRTRIGLTGLSVATSGDYRRFHAVDGRRLAHTLDPRTGTPVSNAPPSVSVLHDQAMLADAWATLLTVLGVDAGLALADAHGIAAIFLHRSAHGWLRSLSAAARAMAE